MQKNSLKRKQIASQEDLEAAASTSAEPQIIPASNEDTEAVANANRQFQITAAREKAHLNLAKQAQRMKLASDSIHARVEIGDNIIIPIPDVDRAKADLRNIIGVVLQMDEQGLHKIGTKYGILDKLYCRTTTSQERLTDLGILYVEKNVVKSLDLDVIVDSFATKHNNRRITLF
ncbi:hypothetical protein MML48_9g00000106 [Holotrichia oblita]|uniref:Uncharacterized protein n=1 Tax=Holotrichia oblita TaxID=644536 RepID=A0ACB9SKD5_HOLOL|nr:hypothetical protein MML48_9g00000106 [Holotrichia oblita]